MDGQLDEHRQTDTDCRADGPTGIGGLIEGQTVGQDRQIGEDDADRQTKHRQMDGRADEHRQTNADNRVDRPTDIEG